MILFSRVVGCVLALGLFAPAAGAQSTDDYLCYKSKVSKGTTRFSKVGGLSVTDSLETGTVDVKKPKLICAPASVDGQTDDPDTHLAAYAAKATKGSPQHSRLENFRVATELGVMFLNTIKADLLLVPSSVSQDVPVNAPDAGSHMVDAFRCYKTKKPKGFPKVLGLTKEDWVSGVRNYDLKKPSHFCPPASIDSDGLKDSDSHLACFKVKASKGQALHQPLSGLHTNGRFGPLSLDTKKVALLCVPTTAVQGCGDGVLQEGEQCDDGNKASGDGCSATCQSELPLTIKVVNMNILHNITQGNVGFNQLTDRLTLLADELAITDPDIVTLQEVVLGATDASRHLAEDLAERYGMTFHHESYGATAGNAVLSRWPMVVAETVRLPSEETVAYHPDRRFAARIVVNSPIGPIDVYSMHMCAGSIGCSSADRVVQMGEFIDFVESTHTSRHPAIVGGDFNSHLGTTQDSNPTSGPSMQAMLDRGWSPVFDGTDAPCSPPGDRSGCTDGISDLTVAIDTTAVRIDNVLVVPGSSSDPRGPTTVAAETGSTTRFADQPYLDPNPRCEFTPRNYCNDLPDCGLLEPAVYCGRSGFCQTIMPCVEDSDCPPDGYDELLANSTVPYGDMVCGTTLWVSDHVGVQTTIIIEEND